MDDHEIVLLDGRLPPVDGLWRCQRSLEEPGWIVARRRMAQGQERYDILTKGPGGNNMVYGRLAAAKDKARALNARFTSSASGPRQPS